MSEPKYDSDGIDIHVDPWVTCKVRKEDCNETWIEAVKASGNFMRLETNGDVIVKYRASELRKVPE